MARTYLLLRQRDISAQTFFFSLLSSLCSDVTTTGKSSHLRGARRDATAARRLLAPSRPRSAPSRGGNRPAPHRRIRARTRSAFDTSTPLSERGRRRRRVASPSPRCRRHKLASNRNPKVPKSRYTDKCLKSALRLMCQKSSVCVIHGDRPSPCETPP